MKAKTGKACATLLAVASLLPSANVLAVRNEITILTASWKSTNSGKGPDVTQSVAGVCNGKVGRCQLVCSNALFGADPEPGHPKICRITFKCEGGVVDTVDGKEDEPTLVACKY
jgi:hypothetical protein